MRIYNGKNSQISVPLNRATRIVVGPKRVSQELMPSDDFLTLLAQTFEADELALIVSGPFEINLCAKNPACQPLVVQSLDEALERFAVKEDPKPEAQPESEKKEEVVTEDVVKDNEPEVSEDVKPKDEVKENVKPAPKKKVAAVHKTSKKQ